MAAKRDVRERLKDDLEARYGKLLEMLDAAMSAEANFRVTDPCPDRYCPCKHFRYVKVPDFPLQLKIAEFMANQGLGRPAVAESESDGERVVFERVVWMTDQEAEAA